MAHFVLLLIGAAVVGLIGFGVTWMIAGRDRGLGPEEPDGAAVPLPNARPLEESDIETVRFDTTTRGYRMGQVDAALRRVAYDIGYKQELINVLDAENEALRDGRMDDANALRDARNSATAARHSGPFAATSHGEATHASHGDATHASHGDATHASHGDASHAAAPDAAGADD